MRSKSFSTWLLQSVQISIRAADIDYADCDQRRRKERSDGRLQIQSGCGGLAPARAENHRTIEFPVGGEHPAPVLAGRLGLKFPEQLAGAEVAGFQSTVENTQINHITRHRWRRENG